MSRLREWNTIVTTGNAINLSPGVVLLAWYSKPFIADRVRGQFAFKVLDRLTIIFVLQVFYWFISRRWVELNKGKMTWKTKREKRRKNNNTERKKTQKNGLNIDIVYLESPAGQYISIHTTTAAVANTGLSAGHIASSIPRSQNLKSRLCNLENKAQDQIQTFENFQYCHDFWNSRFTNTKHTHTHRNIYIHT